MGYFPERRHPRFEFQKLPWVLSLRLGAPSWPEKPTRVEAKNLSQGGLKFFSNRKFQLFEVLQVSLYEKESGKSLITLTGKVVRVEEIDTGFGDRTFGIAIQFLSNTANLGTILPQTSESDSNSQMRVDPPSTDSQDPSQS